MVINHHLHSNQKRDMIDKFRDKKLKQYFVDDPDTVPVTFIFWENHLDQIKYLQNLLTEIQNLCKKGIQEKLTEDKDLIFSKIIKRSTEIQEEQEPSRYSPCDLFSLYV